MKPQFLLAGALALSLFSAAALLPGCGGGGSSTSAPELRFGRERDVQFIDFPEIRGTLRVRFADSASFPARATGTLQVVDVPDFKPSTEPRTEFSVGLAPGTYILTGSVLDGTAGFDYALDLNGSYEGGPRFQLTGNFDDDGLIFIRAPFKSGNSVLRGRVVPRASNTTAGATTGATTTGATAGATTTGGTTGATTTGATTAGGTTGATTAGGTTGATTAGGTTAGGTTVGMPPTLP